MDGAAVFKVLDVTARPREDIFADIRSIIEQQKYEIIEANESKPWGAYYRFSGEQVNRFINEYFPGLSINEAKLGNELAELSPKILVVAPGQRLSWQYHDRRAERWHFLTAGTYHKSSADEAGEPLLADAGTVVQFAQGERHRLCASPTAYTVVAEIWQHTDLNHASDEADIIRLSDDYNR